MAIDRPTIRTGEPPLAIKNGVSPNKLWLPIGNWKTALEFFQWKFPHLETADCVKRFRQNEVISDSGEVLTETSQYQAKQHIYFYRELKSELQVPFREKIIYQNDRILIVDKPHFLPVAPTGQYLHETLLVRLRKTTQIDSLELAHRLDRETAGLVLLTKQKKYRSHYHELFAQRKIKKTYHAITKANDVRFPLNHKSHLTQAKDSMRMKDGDGESNSETKIDLLKQNSSECLLKLNPISGKKHQLRVHLASLGMPIKNDPLYPDRQSKASDDFRHPLQLVAKSIEFIDPIDGQAYCFTSAYRLEFTN
ncbi:MAG: pseudouridine synthase [Kangiellaceae bacterium]|nr:pseudouridine synthase [Kangiellaceae bacterium]